MIMSGELEKLLQKYYMNLGLKQVDEYVKRRLLRERSKNIINFLKKKLNLETIEKLQPDPSKTVIFALPVEIFEGFKSLAKGRSSE